MNISNWYIPLCLKFQVFFLGFASKNVKQMQNSECKDIFFLYLFKWVKSSSTLLLYTLSMISYFEYFQFKKVSYYFLTIEKKHFISHVP